MKLLKDITTGKDNDTFDLFRMIMAVLSAFSIVVLIWGLSLETYRVLNSTPQNQINFSLHDAFTAYAWFLTSVGTFLAGGGISIKLKQDTEPDGSKITSDSLENK